VQLRRVHDWLWEIPREGACGCRGGSTRRHARPGGPCASPVANVAAPGIVGASLAMPDMHWGYGFPSAAWPPSTRSTARCRPGRGYDINCGVRLLSTRLPAAEVRPHLHDALARLFGDVPTGVGSSAAIPRLSGRELDAVLVQGARWAVDRASPRRPATSSTARRGRDRRADPAR